MAQGSDELTRRIIGAAIKVHRHFGPGLLESIYEAALEHELKNLGLRVERQAAVPVVYEGLALDQGFRIDLFVERSVVIELKCVEKFLPIPEAQIISYLKLTGCGRGLLMNFNTVVLKDGIKRFVNNYTL